MTSRRQLLQMMGAGIVAGASSRALAQHEGHDMSRMSATRPMRSVGTSVGTPSMSTVSL